MKDFEKTVKNMIEANATPEDLAAYLQENLTSKEMTEALVAEFYNKFNQEEVTPLRISQSDFDKHFRIIGFKSDGTPETRGRRKTE